MTKLKEKSKNFLGIPFLSIDESKASAIIIVFIISSFTAIWQVIALGDIAVGLLQWCVALLTAITGINVNDRYHKRKEKEIEIEHYDDKI